ncbi:MAG: phosphonate C-P lyase system protein PhnL [Alphaproteobacteria bacterium]
MTAQPPALIVRELSKTFTLHIQGTTLPVLRDIDLAIAPGEAVVLAGPSGAGKSSFMRCVYANYRPQTGSVLVRHDGRMVDMLTAEPRAVLDVRRRTMGFVSQFLRVIPRVPTIDVVAEPLRAVGMDRAAARGRGGDLLARLRIPERLWGLPPATFSGGEQQRVNIARGFAHPYPILLLDEPTASLDAHNRDTVVDMIREAREAGAAVLGIFHDEAVREAVATRVFQMRPLDIGRAA